jgi:hypothetical protein
MVHTDTERGVRPNSCRDLCVIEHDALVLGEGDQVIETVNDFYRYGFLKRRVKPHGIRGM